MRILHAYEPSLSLPQIMPIFVGREVCLDSESCMMIACNIIANVQPQKYAMGTQPLKLAELRSPGLPRRVFVMVKGVLATLAILVSSRAMAASHVRSELVWPDAAQASSAAMRVSHAQMVC